MPRGKLALAALLLAALTGLSCVRREIEIVSSPPGATIEYDGRVLAQRTPARFPFSWYGTHEIVVSKEGYYRERVVKHVEAPWYETFPIDFFAENVWPGTLLDRHTFPFALVKEEPMREAGAEEKAAMKKGLLKRAEDFRREAREKVGAAPPEEPEEAKAPEKLEAPPKPPRPPEPPKPPAPPKIEKK